MGIILSHLLVASIILIISLLIISRIDDYNEMVYNRNEMTKDEKYETDSGEIMNTITNINTEVKKLRIEMDYVLNKMKNINSKFDFLVSEQCIKENEINLNDIFKNENIYSKHIINIKKP